MRILTHRQQQQPNQRRRGAALIETAIVLPVFFLVVLGIIEFGRAFMVMQIVNTAAREATRTAVSDGSTNDEIRAMVKHMVGGAVTVAESKVSVAFDITQHAGNPDPNDEVANANKRDLIKIDVTVAYADVSFFTPKFLATATIRGSSTMRHE